jgi:hypothetical protein
MMVANHQSGVKDTVIWSPVGTEKHGHLVTSGDCTTCSSGYQQGLKVSAGYQCPYCFQKLASVVLAISLAHILTQAK